MRHLKDFPKTMIIGEHEWKVVWKRKITHEGQDCLGLCEPKTRTISIKLGQTPEERASTFLHEALHAIETEYDIDIDHKLVYALEGPLADMFFVNAWVSWAKWEKAG